MTDTPSDPEAIDARLLEKPATRWELWKAIMLMRSLVADVHIHALATRSGDDEARNKASKDYRRSSDQLADFCDDLIGAVTPERDLK